MTGEKETATTMWRDNHSGRRGHQLMTGKLGDTIPALYANEDVEDYDTVLARAKLFSPYSNWTWYIMELDPETGQCFGLVEGFEKEMGYFDLTELAETTVFGGVPAVERDLYWEPKTLGEIKNGSQGDSPDNEETSSEYTMTDETGTETHSSDVVSAEEFLFGHAADETAADAAAKVAEEDADNEAEPEPQGPDEAGDEAAPTEELKVVVSIEGARATIGVQQPASDPHIESFDGLDLSRLAQEVPAVVERARARWEEEPMHPAHERPAPPARRQRRREPGSEQASTDEEGADQPQPETLRLF